jgi:hypothetical protein
MQLESVRGTCRQSVLPRLEPIGLLLNLHGGGGNGRAISIEALRSDELWSSEDSRPVVADSVRSMMAKALGAMGIFGGWICFLWVFNLAQECGDHAIPVTLANQLFSDCFRSNTVFPVFVTY